MHFKPTSGKKELFNLEKDPREREDLSAAYPTLAKAMEEKALAQLNLLNTLYETKGFAPSFTYTASLDLDLSKTCKLTKSTFIKLKKKGLSNPFVEFFSSVAGNG